MAGNLLGSDSFNVSSEVNLTSESLVTQSNIDQLIEVEDKPKPSFARLVQDIGDCV